MTKTLTFVAIVVLSGILANAQTANKPAAAPIKSVVASSKPVAPHPNRLPVHRQPPLNRCSVTRSPMSSIRLSAASQTRSERSSRRVSFPCWSAQRVAAKPRRSAVLRSPWNAAWSSMPDRTRTPTPTWWAL